ncbi:predicted protein [Plenodomus lingam JN3]|uniref:Predicted protein n=1 Tax=Leptosphaeria maculans (strain JN3 / isolate v23.1.3 / race Av1-4-5-6-7-8) TaxID=985895 RepID=E4ZUZ3_LEPMJ|nr:predicted protein [Plenodomus lingam JN3]CBX94930.1 predicted protein [Plenodomus lingam JN3]
MHTQETWTRNSITRLLYVLPSTLQVPVDLLTIFPAQLSLRPSLLYNGTVASQGVSPTKSIRPWSRGRPASTLLSTCRLFPPGFPARKPRRHDDVSRRSCPRLLPLFASLAQPVNQARVVVRRGRKTRQGPRAKGQGEENLSSLWFGEEPTAQGGLAGEGRFGSFIVVVGTSSSARSPPTSGVAVLARPTAFKKNHDQSQGHCLDALDAGSHGQRARDAINTLGVDDGREGLYHTCLTV